MKKALAIILAVIMTVSLLAFGSSAETADVAFTGEGTAASPYLIASAGNLKYLQKQVASGATYEGKYFTQTADIDLGNEEWTPIGSSSAPFSGVYNGCNYEIKGLYITKRAAAVGLFGYITSTTETECGISNLTVTGSIKISADIADNDGIGGIVGWASKDPATGLKTIYLTNLVGNVNIELTNVAKQPRVGAIAGFAFTSYFENVVNNGNVTYAGGAVSRVGGIAGQSNRSTYKSCVNNGTINVSLTTANATAAGICPIVTYKVDDIYTEFINCVNNGNITAKTAGNNAVYVGGVTVNPYSSGAKYFLKVDGCANTGDIYGETASTTAYVYAGGIFGYANKLETYVTNCVNTGKITGVGGAGNRAGEIASVINVSSSSGIAVSGNICSGAVCGWASAATPVENNTNNADATALSTAVKAVEGKLAASEVKIGGFDTAAASQPAPATADTAVYYVLGAAIVMILGTAVVVKKKEN